MCYSFRVLCLYFLRETRKEVCMEIPELVSYHYSQVKFVTLQELLANNMRSLIKDSKKCVNTHE